MACTYNKLQFGQNGLTVDGTLIRFNCSMDVPSPVCAGPDVLHGKRVFFGFGSVCTRRVRLIGKG